MDSPSLLRVMIDRERRPSPSASDSGLAFSTSSPRLLVRIYDMRYLSEFDEYDGPRSLQLGAAGTIHYIVS